MADKSDNVEFVDVSQPSSRNAPVSPTPQQALMGALEMHYIAKRTKALANLNQYMTNPVGVAEHPDIVAEAIKLMEEINHSDGMLETLKHIMS